MAQETLHDALGALSRTLVPDPGDDDDCGAIRHWREPYDGGGRLYHRATMTGSGGRAQELDCVVVGGGLAGLSCAHDLARGGALRARAWRPRRRPAAARAPCGTADARWTAASRCCSAPTRARRALLRAIGIPRRDLRPVGGRGGVRERVGTHRLGTSRLAVAGFTGLAPPDRAKLMRLAVEVAARPPQSLLDDGEDAGSTEELPAGAGVLG